MTRGTERKAEPEVNHEIESRLDYLDRALSSAHAMLGERDKALIELRAERMQDKKIIAHLTSQLQALQAQAD